MTMESYGIVKIPVATIWEGRSEIKENSLGETVSAISDEGLYGMGLSDNRGGTSGDFIRCGHFTVIPALLGKKK
jgi:hypothetical protein